MSLRDSLQSIYDQHKTLTPELVVAEATDPDHELHPRFEWDDTIAGPKYRLIQAADLIRSVRVVVRPATDKEPASLARVWVAPREATAPHVYEPMDVIARDPMKRAMVLRNMEREWRELKRRCEGIEEFWPMVSADVPQKRPRRRRSA